MSYQSRVSTLGRVWGFQEPSENGHPYPPSSAPRLVTPGNVDLIETCENLQVAQIDFQLYVERIRRRLFFRHAWTVVLGTAWDRGRVLASFVAMTFVTSSVLAGSSKARSYVHSVLAGWRDGL